MKNVIGFIFAIICYLAGVGGLFYIIFWMGNLLPFDPLDGPAEVSPITALLINVSLISLFGVQHSIMARKTYKYMIAGVVPRHIHRSIYVLVSGLICMVIALYWEPIEGQLWFFESGSLGFYILYGIFFFGIVFLLASTFLVNHFELFGLKQTFDKLKGRVPAPQKFKAHFLYRLVRHPIYLGFTLILFAAPDMSMTRFCLASCFFLYIFIGIYFEELDLIEEFGDVYQKYKKRVPKVIPFTKW